MTSATKAIIDAAVRADPTVSREQARAAMSALNGEGAAVYANAEPMDRALSRSTVAELLGVSKRTVTIYAKRGVIRACRFGRDGRRAAGYSEQSVREALARRG